MTKNILHYSILSAVSVIALLVIMFGFSQYNNALGTNSVATNADLNTNLNIDNVGADSNVAAVTNSLARSPGQPRSALVSSPGFTEALAIVNSFVSPNLTPAQANGSEEAQYAVTQTAAVPPDTYSLIDHTGLSGELYPSNMCHHPMTITTAKWIRSRMNEHGINADFLTATTSQYVQIDEENWAYFNIGRIFGSDGVSPSGAPVFGYCLDAGYVSNYPNYINKYTAFYNAHPNANLGNLYTFGQTKSDYTRAARNGTTVSSTGTGTTVTTPVTSATSSKAYTVSVDYSHFTAEAAANGYTSVYTTTGTKSVSITVFKFPNGSSLSATQAISQLAALGYRPATLSELYALKTAQPSVGSSIVGLGTNLSSSYGYPTSSGSGTSSLGRSVSPFSTTLYSFAAVQN